MNSSKLPKISCVTVTLNRLVLLKEAIQCYCDQVYLNKELVIVTDGQQRYKDAIYHYINTLDRSDIRLISIDESGSTLGCLRNISVDAASGDIICQWDDDDLFHPNRLQTQFDYMNMEHAETCFFTDQLHFFMESCQLYWVDWTNGSWDEKWQMIPGTLMMYKDPRFRYPEEGQFARSGEDSILLDQVYKETKVARLSGSGYLYVYRYHGMNTFAEQHHMNQALGLCVDNRFIQQYKQELDEALNYFPLSRPYNMIHASIQ